MTNYNLQSRQKYLFFFILKIKGGKIMENNKEKIIEENLKRKDDNVNKKIIHQQKKRCKNAIDIYVNYTK